MSEQLAGAARRSGETGNVPDDALVSQILHGDGAAWTPLFDRHQRKLLGAVAACLQKSYWADDVEDVAQEVWLGLLKNSQAHLRRFNPKSASFSRFLRLRLLDALAEFRNSRLHQGEFASLETDVIDAQDPHGNDWEALALLDEFVMRLSPRECERLWQRMGESPSPAPGKTMTEVNGRKVDQRLREKMLRNGVAASTRKIKEYTCTPSQKCRYCRDKK